MASLVSLGIGSTNVGCLANVAAILLGQSFTPFVAYLLNTNTYTSRRSGTGAPFRVANDAIQFAGFLTAFGVIPYVGHQYLVGPSPTLPQNVVLETGLILPIELGLVPFTGPFSPAVAYRDPATVLLPTPTVKSCPEPTKTSPGVSSTDYAFYQITIGLMACICILGSAMSVRRTLPAGWEKHAAGDSLPDQTPPISATGQPHEDNGTLSGSDDLEARENDDPDVLSQSIHDDDQPPDDDPSSDPLHNGGALVGWSIEELSNFLSGLSGPPPPPPPPPPGSTFGFDFLARFSPWVKSFASFMLYILHLGRRLLAKKYSRRSESIVRRPASNSPPIQNGQRTCSNLALTFPLPCVGESTISKNLFSNICSNAVALIPSAQVNVTRARTVLRSTSLGARTLESTGLPVVEFLSRTSEWVDTLELIVTLAMAIVPILYSFTAGLINKMTAPFSSATVLFHPALDQLTPVLEHALEGLASDNEVNSTSEDNQTLTAIQGSISEVVPPTKFTQRTSSLGNLDQYTASDTTVTPFDPRTMGLMSESWPDFPLDKSVSLPSSLQHITEPTFPPTSPIITEATESFVEVHDSQEGELSIIDIPGEYLSAQSEQSIPESMETKPLSAEEPITNIIPVSEEEHQEMHVRNSTSRVRVPLAGLATKEIIAVEDHESEPSTEFVAEHIPAEVIAEAAARPIEEVTLGEELVLDSPAPQISGADDELQVGTPAPESVEVPAMASLSQPQPSAIKEESVFPGSFSTQMQFSSKSETNVVKYFEHTMKRRNSDVDAALGKRPEVGLTGVGYPRVAITLSQPFKSLTHVVDKDNKRLENLSVDKVSGKLAIVPKWYMPLSVPNSVNPPNVKPQQSPTTTFSPYQGDGSYTPAHGPHHVRRGPPSAASSNFGDVPAFHAPATPIPSELLLQATGSSPPSAPLPLESHDPSPVLIRTENHPVRVLAPRSLQSSMWATPRKPRASAPPLASTRSMTQGFVPRSSTVVERSPRNPGCILSPPIPTPFNTPGSRSAAPATPKQQRQPKHQRGSATRSPNYNQFMALAVDDDP